MDVAEIERRVLAGERPRFTDEVLQKRRKDPVIAGLCDLIEKCWAQDPLARPPIDQVVKELERLEAILKTQPDADEPFPTQFKNNASSASASSASPDATNHWLWFS